MAVAAAVVCGEGGLEVRVKVLMKLLKVLMKVRLKGLDLPSTYAMAAEMGLVGFELVHCLLGVVE